MQAFYDPYSLEEKVNSQAGQATGLSDGVGRLRIQAAWF